MTSFAVTKNGERDRLISWPKVQNMYMPDPPYTDLPNPSHFDKLRQPGNNQLGAFYFDVENMFHNIRLPDSLSRFFPLQTVAFGQLPKALRNELCGKWGFTPDSTARIRPLQTTLPMGFKWAVFIAHTFANTCVRQAFNMATISNDQEKTLIPLNNETGTLYLKSGDALLLHIIDDITVVCCSWKDEEVIAFHRCCESVFKSNCLPLKIEKSSAVGQVEKMRVDFIGWVWTLRSGVFRPRTEKLVEAVKQAHGFVCSAEFNSEYAEKITGKIIWIALGLRPLFSVLNRLFLFNRRHRKKCQTAPGDSLIQAVKREIRMVVALLPLSFIRTMRRNWTTIVCFDASLQAGAVVFTNTDCAAARLLDESAEYSRNFHLHGDWLTEGKDGFLTTPAIEPLKSVPKISEFVKSHVWQTAIIHEWRRKQHINYLEAHSAVMSLEWAISNGVSGARIFMISDSAVTIGALTKGRSSSQGMLLPCRQFGALCIAHDVKALLIHVRSEDNPANGPSRPHSI